MHLLGETIAQRWNDDVKREIRDSRVLGTRNLVAALRALPEAERPRVLVSQSATGFYGPRGDERLDEGAPAGDDFLAGVVVDWEAEASAAEELGVRVVLTRTGVVLSESGGALEKMLPFFKLGVGGPVAGGRQYVPWVHLDDVVGRDAVRARHRGRARAAERDGARARHQQGVLARARPRAAPRPPSRPCPALAVKTLYGEMATIVTTGQRAVPGAPDRARLRASGGRTSRTRCATRPG